MLDIKLIREQPETVKAAIARKRADTTLIDQIVGLDSRVRALKTESESLRAEQNAKSKDFGKIKREGGDVAALQARLAELKDLQAKGKDELEAAEAELAGLLDVVPNIPDASVPDGGGAEDNVVVKEWGTPPVGKKAEPHWEVGKRMGLELERGTAMSGGGFVLSIGKLPKLERALIGLFLDHHTSKHGYQEVSVPFVVRRPALYGTGYLPKLEGEQYHIERDELYLVPTAEVPLTAIHADSILKEEELPRKYCAFSPCWRREAGAAGADTRGLVRVHQFLKVEMMQVVHPSRSAEAHETLTRTAEELLELLELPYRRLLLCSGDMSFAAAKCFDLEVYSAGVARWLEVSSCSNFSDFQARRSKIRFKDAKNGANEYCHTLNGSGLALSRIVVAILENNQQPDGTVALPKALWDRYGAKVL